MKYNERDVYPLATSSLSFHFLLRPWKSFSFSPSIQCFVSFLSLFFFSLFLFQSRTPGVGVSGDLARERERERDEKKKWARWTGNYTRQSDCPLLNLIGRLIMRSLESIRSKTETDSPGELCRCVVVFHLRSAKPSMRMVEWRTGERIAAYFVRGT